jgi:hypothetical protein
MVMCDNNVGVAKRIDLEDISEDIARLVKQLDREVEGDIRVDDVRTIETKLKKIVAS